MEVLEEIKKYLQNNIKNIINLRGYFHENPELSECEFNTRGKIKEELLSLDIKYIDVEGNSILGFIDTEREGKSILLRAELDALAVEENENNFKGKKSFISKNEGVAHMCGHDSHITILIESIKLICKNIDKFNGKIYFVFEEAEENGRGIRKIYNDLANLGVDACFGLHVVNFLKSGELSIDAGPRMAGVNGIDIDIIGHGGHGSRPDLSINPLFCGADILNTISTLWANKFAPDEVCTLGITNLAGGNSHNIIEEKMKIMGTIRYFSENAGKKGINIITETAKSIGKLYNCEIKINHKMETSNGLINDEELSEFMKDKLKAYLPDELVGSDPWYGSETFARYNKIAPSLFAFLGNRNEEKGIIAENHDPRFDIDDERVLPLGIKYTVMVAYLYLNEY